jgi:hypothetical protein
MIDILYQDDSLNIEQRTAQQFWKDKKYEYNIFADDNNGKTKLLLINVNTNKTNTQLTNCDTYNGNGTWSAVASTDATNVRTDDSEYTEGSGSVAFDIDVSLSGTNTAAIENATLTAVDISSDENKSMIFARVYLPDVTYITSLSLRWGSSSSDYWTASVTTQFSGVALVVGYNVVAFNWNGAVETGTADAAAIDYIRYTINFSASQVDDTDFRIDDIRSKMPYHATALYYSQYFIQDADGTYKEEFVDGDDVTVLEQHHEDMLMYLALEEAFDVDRQKDDAGKARTDFEIQLKVAGNDKISEKQKPSDSYYYLT